MSVWYGATRAEWDAFATLNLVDLLPWVAMPGLPRHPKSKLPAEYSKTPSYYRDDNKGTGVSGMLNWPEYITTSVHDWHTDPRLGICMIARHIKCLDIDIPDIVLAKEVEAAIREELGIDGMMLPLRDREGTGNRALIYRLGETMWSDYQRAVIRDGNGIVEFLGDSKQFVVAGMHKSGNRYRWPDGIPKSLDDIPVIEPDKLIGVYNMLWQHYGPEGKYREWRYTDGKVSRENRVNKYENDPVVQLLVEQDRVLGYSPHNGVYVRCPWEHMHSNKPNDADATDVEYFPAGANGRATPGFKCFHGHSLGNLDFDPTHVEFLDIIGYRGAEIAAEFPMVDVDPEAPVKVPRPKFTNKGRSSIIENTISNVTAMLRWSDGGGYRLRYDRFKDEIVYRLTEESTWSRIDDDTYTAIRIKFATLGMEPPAHETVQRAVSYVARQQSMDSAQEWLKAQEWDGKHRIPGFHARVLGLADTDYHQAVMDYMWTALAGRVLDPGCKADMVPILMGKQGLRKSTFVELIAPSPDEYTVVTLADRDADLARMLRGRMVAEWDELRGLNTRDADALKGWVSRRKDDWVPKFKEFGTSLERRFLLIGTSNPLRVLNDPTGLRRWLPLVIRKQIDSDYVALHRNQLWAEAATMWRHENDRTELSGVLWERAERLGKQAQHDASIRDPWVDAVSNWFQCTDSNGPWTALEILNQACNVPIPQINYGTQERLRRVMAFMYWEEEVSGKWSPPIA